MAHLLVSPVAPVVVAVTRRAERTKTRARGRSDPGKRTAKVALDQTAPVSSSADATSAAASRYQPNPARLRVSR